MRARPRLSLAVAFLLATAFVASAEPVTGRVFLDANANGRLDEGETGVAGVHVTDGLSFAKTDAEGRYTIDAKLDPLLRPGEAPILTVSFPTGYWPTAGWFRRVEAASGSADFGLRRDEQALPFVFIHATDPHVPRGGRHMFPAFRAEMDGLKDTAKFCILTGDLVNNADGCNVPTAKADFQFLAEHSRDFPMPLFNIPGNHDCAGVRAKTGWDEQSPDFAYGLYWRVVGPLRWSFDHAGVHFVGIDFNRKVEGQWAWGVPQSAVEWLEEDLARAPKDARVLVFVHWPMGVPKLAEVLGGIGDCRIFAGHSHGEGPLSFAGVRGWQSGSLSQTGGDRKPGYRLVLVTKEGVEGFYKALGEQHAITLDTPRGRSTLSTTAEVAGGFYDPDEAIQRLTVSFGSVRAAVPFRRTPICCRFEAALDLAAVPRGFTPLRVEIASPDDAWSFEHKFLLLSDRDAPFEASDGQLELEVAGIDGGATVLLNGRELAALKPTKLGGDGPFRAPVREADTVQIPVAKDQLQRLNLVALRCAAGAGGGTDAFCVLDVRIRHRGKLCRDVRIAHGPWHPRTVKGKTTYYIDLSAGE